MLKPVSVEIFTRKPNSKLAKEIEEFANSEYEIAEIETSAYKTLTSAYSSYLKAVKRSKYGMRVIQNGCRIFLVKESAYEKIR